jgi:hypothetical protein
LRPGSLFFVPAPLEGWGLDVLLDRLPPESAVVVFDKDEQLERRCGTAFAAFLGSRAGDGRLFRLSADTEAAVQELFSRLPLAKLRRCEFLALNGAWTPDAARYRQVFTRFDQGLTRWWANRITSLHLGPLWVKNLFDNSSAPGFQAMPWPDWGTQPVLVCGAGATLEDALPWAAVHRDRLRLVAADTALPVFKASGLVPDAVVCLESQHANLRDFAGWSSAPVLLFADLTAYPPSTRVFGNPPHWFASTFAEVDLFRRWPWGPVPLVPALGSVGVAAAWVAWRLTQGPVVLAGLDFSFPPGKTHARGTPALAALLAATNRLRPTEQEGSWNRPGVTAKGEWLTTPALEGYAAVLAEKARDHAERTWVWKTGGLPLGLEPWPADRVPGANHPSGAPGGRAAPDTGAGIGAPDRGPGAWLDDERRRLTAVLADFERLNAAPHDEAAWSDLERGLNEVDYLTFAFPDPEFRRDYDWLARAQHQVRWLLERLSRPRWS